jgi:hypothetical protein
MYLSRGDRIGLIFLGAIVAIPVTLLLAALILDNVIPSKVRRALPASATEIKQFDGDNPLSREPDTTLYPRARMPESEMPGFAAKLDLVQRYSGALHSRLPLNFSGRPAWWDNRMTMDGACVNVTLGRSRVEYAIAKYHGGYVYVKTTY